MGEVEIRAPRQRLVAPGEIEHYATDLTVTACAELTLAALQARLAERDQWLPIDGDPQSPIRTLIEMNSTGPQRLGYGAWRDLLLGMQFMTSDGQFITAGGRTMKNVAGYDLTKFMVGQFGLFGKIQTVTTRTYKRPAEALLARFEPSDKLVGQLLPTPARPQWAMLTEGSLWCGYLGDAKAIAFQEAQLSSSWQPLELKRQTLEEDIDFRARHWLPHRPPIRYRASVPPSRVLEFAAKWNLHDYAADAAFGIIVGSCVADRMDALRDAARTAGGNVVFDDPDDLRNFSGAVGAELHLLKRIQSALGIQHDA